MKFMRYLPLLMATLVLSGCPELGRHWSDQEETLQVDYYKAQCDKNSADICFRTRELSTDSWGISDAKLSGFTDFVWGHRYTINVTTSFNSNGNPSSYSYNSIEEDVPVVTIDTPFQINLYTENGVLTQLGADAWYLGGEKNFTCASDCEVLATAVSNQYVVVGEFSINAGELTLDQVICSSSEEGFSSDCEGETEVDWQIAPFLSDCGKSSASLCYLYRLNSSDDWEILPVDIANFSYDWGYRYDITVQQTRSSTGTITAASLVTDDGSPLDYTGSTYTYKIILLGSALANDSSGVITLYDGAQELNCSQYSQCNDLNTAIDNDEWILVKVFTDGSEVVATDVVCRNDNIDDFNSCVADENDVTWSIE